MSEVLDEVPVNRLHLDPLAPARAGLVSMVHLCGIGDKHDNEKKWEVLRNI